MIITMKKCISSIFVTTIVASCASTPEECDPSQPGLFRALGCNQSGAYEQRASDLRAERDLQRQNTTVLRAERSERVDQIRALAAERRRLVEENSELRASNRRLRNRIADLRSNASISSASLGQLDRRLRELEAERLELEELLLGDDPMIDRRLDQLNQRLEMLREANRQMVQILSDSGG